MTEEKETGKVEGEDRRWGRESSGNEGQGRKE